MTMHNRRKPDDKDLNRQIAAALTQAGYAVDRAFDGEEGWFLGDTEPYDAIVLDLGLPKRMVLPCSVNGAGLAAPCRC